MTDLSDLYQEVILDHNRRPRNFRAMEHASRTQEGYNPLCGDRLMLYVKLEGDRIVDVAFQGSGCAISKASASLMTEALKGKTVTRRGSVRPVSWDGDLGARHAAPDLGSCPCSSGVREYPTRVKCASLPWHTLKAAVAGDMGTVSTE